MGESKSKKTISKLGKLFGVLHTNLTLLNPEEDTELPFSPKTTSKNIVSPSTSKNASPSTSNISPSISETGGYFEPHHDQIKQPGNSNNFRKEQQSISPLLSLLQIRPPLPHLGQISSQLHLAQILLSDLPVSPPRSPPPNKQRITSTTISTVASSGSSVSAVSHADAGDDENDDVSPLPNDIRLRSSSPMPGRDKVDKKDKLLNESTLPSLPASVEKPQKHLQTVTKSNLQTLNNSLAGKRQSPPVSRSSSLSGARKSAQTSPKPNMPSPIVSNGQKLNPVSRSSSTKVKPSGTSSTSLLTMVGPQKPRFRMLENGFHEHNLKCARRQEKLSNMLKDLLGAKKLRDEAKSAVPNILHGAIGQSNNSSAQAKPPTLFAGLVNHVKNNTSPYHMTTNGQITSTVLNAGPDEDSVGMQDLRSFVEKYGRCNEVIGRGSFGVVRISHKKIADVAPKKSADVSSNAAGQPIDEILYAVKEFKRKPSESDKKYNRRLTSEFCISSSLKHVNIIETLDLLKDAKGDYCEVMEYCSGGDLYTLIIALGKLEYAEADCFFKQLIRGVNYMHDMGVSHRDLKPENILLTQTGTVKITDFGNGECFKMAWEKEIQLSEGVCGSSPYIAPEEFTQLSFDPRCVDIWACGVIYMAMRTGRQLWKLADASKDEFFEEYLVKRKDATGYEPIESLKRARCRNVIYSILDPKPDRRITGKQILNSEWGREIKVCEAGEGH